MTALVAVSHGSAAPVLGETGAAPVELLEIVLDRFGDACLGTVSR